MVVFAVTSGVEIKAAEGRPIIIAHRGASGELPEHTLEAFQRAIEQGADFIEPDLVMTKDGHMVVRHDLYLSTTTNVADLPEYAGRRRDFEGRTDWFVFDFTLAELKTLKARQPWEQRSKGFDDRFSIPTFDEVIDLVQKTGMSGRMVGIYPEMKHPSVFKKLGLDPTGPLLERLNLLTDEGIDVYFQCFDADFLNSLKGLTEAKRILLLWAVEDGAGGFKPNLEVKPFLGPFEVDGFGISKQLVFNREGDPSFIMQAAKELGVPVHVWTIRDDQLPKGYKSVEAELKALYGAGVDGVFTDFPGSAVRFTLSHSLLSRPPMVD